MRFLDTNNTQANSQIVYSLVHSMLPNTLTMGILCLAGGVGYYSWNYYKNKNKDVNTTTNKKNEIENKLSQIKNETNSNNLATIITSEKNSSNMLDDIEKEFVIVNDNHNAEIPFEFINANNDDEWEMVYTPTNVTNTI